MSDGNEASIRHLPTKSKRESLEHALVLASQGLEPKITHDHRGWGLEIEESHAAHAENCLRTYSQENKRRPFKGLPEATDSIHPAVLLWCAIIAAIYAWQTQAIEGVGMVDAIKVTAGQWWRLITAVTLHGDIGHLASNLTTGFLFIGLAMSRHGAGAGILGALLAGIFGNLLSYWVNGEGHRSLGASGMVLGGLGLLAVQRFLWKEELARRLLISSLGAAAMILVLFGFTPGTDILAHAGGFVGGIGIALLFTRVPLKTLRSWPVSALCLAVACGLTLLAWKFAIGRLS